MIDLTHIGCVYLTIYSGNLLPPFYIESSCTDNVLLKNYRGTVSSKKYKKIWLSELKINPQFFKTKIIATTLTREEATAIELRLQTKLNVVKSPMYINMARATKDGCFGMAAKGEDSPHYGVKRRPRTEDEKLHQSKMIKGTIQTAEDRKKKSISNTGKSHGNGKGNLPQRWIDDDALILKYTEILQLYLTKPELPIPFNCKGKNGKLITYEIAFGHTYSEIFEMTMQKINLFVLGKVPAFYSAAMSLLEKK